MMTTAEILRAAKDLLIQRGWCQGDELAIHGPPSGPCCAATAMGPFVSFDTSGFSRPHTLFRRVNGIIGNIADWNDAPERTLDDVLAAYDKAITAADMAVTAGELRAMPRSKAVVAFLRACRTYDEVGDIDGPWHDDAIMLLCGVTGAQDRKALFQWEKEHTKDEVFAVYDKAIEAAESAS